MSEAQQTLVLVKPDAVRRGLVGEILRRYEAKALTIEALELRTIDAAFADRHYAEHVAKPWYPQLRDFITGGPLVAMILSGDSAIESGPHDQRCDPTAARPLPARSAATCRTPTRRTVVHASDSPESAAREIALWFPGLG